MNILKTMQWLLVVLLLCQLAALHGFGQSTPAKTDPPVVHPSGVNPLDGPFLGFGAEWDIRAYPSYGFQRDDPYFNLIRERLQWMRLPFVRVMMVSNWCYGADGTFDWESPQMKLLLRELDICEELGMSVILTEWGLNDTWLKTQGIAKIDDPKYAEVIGTYLNYLLNEKKYRCIKYFVFTNEPTSNSREQWLAGLSNVAAELKKRGLSERIRLSAPDQSCSFDLLGAAIERLGPMLGAYELHLYANQNQAFPTTEQAAKSGEIRRYFTEAWKIARTQDPDVTKPLLVGEAGYWARTPEVEKSTSAGHNAFNRDWRYGFFMAQYAVQAVQAGTWGISAWMLEDSAHAGFNWGMWGPKSDHFALKPWFYTWALLSRSFPPGSSFALMDSPQSGLQMIGAKLPNKESKGKASWSFCLINTEKNAASLRLQIPGGEGMKMACYLYAEKNALADENGFPKPVEELKGRWDLGVPVTCPPESVTILTSAP